MPVLIRTRAKVGAWCGLRDCSFSFLKFSLLVITSRSSVRKTPQPPFTSLHPHASPTPSPSAITSRGQLLWPLSTCATGVQISSHLALLGWQFSTWISYLCTANILEVNRTPPGWDKCMNLINYESGGLILVKIYWFDNLQVKPTSNRNHASLFSETRTLLWKIGFVKCVCALDLSSVITLRLHTEFYFRHMGPWGEILEMKIKVLFSVGYPDFIYCWASRLGATSFHLYVLRESAFPFLLWRY